MNPSSLDLLQSQEAIQKLASRDLRGVFALRLADILDEVDGRLQKLQGVQEDLARRVDEGDLQQDEADEQFRELLEETLEINAEPIPRSALRTIEISVADLQTLSWLFEEPAENSTDEETG
jgi:two-component sensor histidine kinase